jgi:ribosomal protein S12 methylthiotransferase accessory factor
MSPAAPFTNRICEVLEHIVDERVGIVRLVEEVHREAGAPALFYFYAKACNTKAFCQQQNSSDAGGASTNRINAISKALGEAIERYCCAIFSPEDIPITSFKSAPFTCVPPQEFALYSEAQYRRSGFPFVRFEENTIVGWARCTELCTSRSIYVPVSMVYLPYYCRQSEGEQPIVQTISTGLACHESYEAAAMSAISEVIERDAFMIMWQAMLSPPKIAIESLSPTNQDLVGRILQPWRSVTLFNITTDVDVPTVLVAIQSTVEEAPAIAFAAATHLNPEKAVRKSLEEAAYTWIHAQRLKLNLAPISSDDAFAAVVDQDKHLRFYGEHKNRHLAEFVFRSKREIDFRELPNHATGDPGQDLKILVQKVHAINHRVLTANLTSPDVAELGLCVVRAVIPGFHPLFMGHSVRAQGGVRLWTIPQKLGYRGIEKVTGDNPSPHPYP